MSNVHVADLAVSPLLVIVPVKPELEVLLKVYPDNTCNTVALPVLVLKGFTVSAPPIQ